MFNSIKYKKAFAFIAIVVVFIGGVFIGRLTKHTTSPEQVKVIALYEHKGFMEILLDFEGKIHKYIYNDDRFGKEPVVIKEEPILIDPTVGNEDVPQPKTEEEPEEFEEESEIEFLCTAYCPCIECCGKTDAITSTGVIAQPNHTIAVDPDIIPYGSTVIIEGIEYIAEDCGGAIQSNHIDIFFASHEEALEYGTQYHTIKIINN